MGTGNKWVSPASAGIRRINDQDRRRAFEDQASVAFETLRQTLRAEKGRMAKLTFNGETYALYIGQGFDLTYLETQLPGIVYEKYDKPGQPIRNTDTLPAPVHSLQFSANALEKALSIPGMRVSLSTPHGRP